MADQKIGVILDFKANTSQAKQSMAQLQQYLTQISSGANLNVNSASIQTASKAAKELAYHLSAAYNADTGKLDLGKLNASLNSAKANIGDLSSRLLQAGATGQQAFVQLAKSMSMAEAPAFRLNGIVSKLWVSLKNVATWQISSAVLMGFISSISEAYQFAQDLNKSLNEIRIVTGNSAEEMQRFAKEANKAAKALSTTTTKYTDASLIYFQQGLNEKQVKERTDLTIKMANVTGQSVSEVSDQLTAVWNNFDDGAKTLEYYVDVMTALGAATASSSEEISEGLNKFAAVAETVGLSYEYAAAALATVTATTRQSADIVGTAFKTLFARIQDLELGETLDDGTTMGQYSQALAAVGINIKDVNGEVKDMNIILDEMGAKWNTLTKDTQIALAQNVAGVRQYTQLIALMDNWSYFQENLNTAYTSTGELQKQADIYAESWEAARDRVTASLEDIYQDVLKDDFFIDLLNGIADVIEGVDTFIERLGGIEPIIIGLSSLLLNSISNKIQPAMYSIISSIRSITPTGAANEAAKASQPMVKKIDKQLAIGNYNQSDKTALENSKQLLQVKNQLWARQKDMTEAEKQMAQIDLDLIEKTQSELQATADIITKLQEKIHLQEKITIQTKIEQQQKKQIEIEEKKLQEQVNNTKKIYEENQKILKNHPALIQAQSEKVQQLQGILQKTQKGTKEYDKIQLRLNNIIRERATLIGQLGAAQKYDDQRIYITAYEEAQQKLEQFQNSNKNIQNIIAQVSESMTQAYQKVGQAAAEAGEKATEAFLQGKSQIGLGDIGNTFFENNKNLFEGRGNRATVPRSQEQVQALRDTLGEEVVQQAGLAEKFDAVGQASSVKELRTALAELKTAFQEATVNSEAFENAIKNFGDVGEQAINDVRKPLQDLDKQYKELQNKQKDLNAQISKFQPKHIATGTEIFSKMSSGITSAVMALNGLNSISKQIKENGLPDTFEEWMSILTSLVFVVPQVMNAIKGLGGGFIALITKMNSQIIANNDIMAERLFIIDAQGNKVEKMTIAELYAAAAKKAGAEATEDQIKAEIGEIAVSEGLINANNKEAFSESVLTAAKQKGTIWSKLKASADNGSAIAKGILNIAQKLGIITINAETGAVIANTAAWYANPIMWIAAIIIGVVAALALLTYGILKVTGALDKEKTSLEKATEAAKAQQEALEAITDAAEEMKNKLQEVKDLLSSYSEVSNAFDGLVVGSSAYNENLQKQSELINELLEKYPELIEMGIIGLNNGRYQVDEAVLEQYLIGDATVKMLSTKIAQAYAAEDLAVAQAEVNKESKLSEINDQLKKAKSIDTYSAGTDVVIKAQDGTEWSVGGSSAYNLAEARAPLVQNTFDQWQKRLSEGETLEDIENGIFKDQYNTELFAAFKGYIDNQTQYTEQIAEVNDEHLKELEKINKQYEQRYNSLAQEVLSYQKGFSQLNQFQQSATIAQVGKSIAANNKTYEFQTGKGNNFNEELAEYILKSTGVEKSSEYNFKADTEVNDIGDFFVNTKEGTMAAAAYLRDVKGLTDMSREMLNDGTYTFDTKGMKSGEGSKYEIELDWAEIAAYYQGQAVYESIDYAGIMAEAANRSDAANAAIGGAIGGLSEEDIAKIARGDRDSGYTLDKNSADIAQAANALGLVKGTSEYEEWLAGLQEQLNKYDAALAETMLMQQDFQRGNQLISDSAEKYGLDAEVVENYAKSLYNANKAQGMTYESASKLAIANSRMSKGISTLREDWGDISQDLLRYSKDTYEWMEAATKASQALEEIFGVAVSTNFIDTYKDKIQMLVDGGDDAVEVFQELELLAGQDYVMSLNLDEEYKTQFKSMLEELTAQEYDGITIGIKGEIDQSYIDSINKLLETGAITTDEVNAMFNSIGWDPNITTKEGEPVETVQEQHIITADNKNYTDGEESWQKIVTTTIPQVPVIGDVTSAPKSTSSIKTNTTSGGSGGSKKQKKDKNTEIERYHEINEELQDLQRIYDNISKAKDRAFGKTKLSYLAQELQATEDLIEAQKRYIGEIEDKKIEDTNKLTEYGANIDPETGRLTNYDQMYQANIDQYNWAVDQFNANKMTEEQFEEYEKEYEEFVKDIEQYEETVNLLEDEMDGLVDLQNQLFDQKLEAIEYSVELDTTLAEDAIKTLQYQIDNLGDGWEDVTSKLGLYGKTLEQEVRKMESNKNALRETLGLSVEDVDALIADPAQLEEMLNSKEMTADQIQALQDYRDGLIDAEKAAKEMRNTIQDELITTFENWNDEMNEEIETLDHLSSMLQGYRDIIDLVGKDNLGISNDLLAKMNQTNVDNANIALKSTKTILEANKASLAEAQANLNKARMENQEEDIKFWEETVKTMSETVTAGEEELMSRWQEALQAAADAYTDAVDQVLKTFEKAMSGVAGSFDNMQTKYDQQKTINERYLADYEKIYNLSKLTRDIENSIDDTDSIRAKSKLRDIQEEIYKLQESGAQVTQYEVDELRARYDLRLAEIALEEAQNAKSQVRMRRDNEGNWSYVYTADEDATANAAQNVEDKLYAYQELTQNRIQEMQDQMIQLPQEYADAIRAIATDMTLTEQERQDRMAETTKFYESQYEYLGQQLGIATDDAKWLYENDWNNYSVATGYKISSNQLWIDSFNETSLVEITGYNNLSDIHTAFESSTKLMLEGIAGAYATYETNVDTAMDNAGTSVSDFSKLVEEETEGVKKDAEEAGDKIANLAEDGKTGFKGLVDAAKEWLDDYQEAMKPYIEENEKWIKSIGDIITKYGDMNNALTPLKTSLDEVGKKAEAAAAKVTQIDNINSNDDTDDDIDELPKPEPPSSIDISSKYYGNHDDYLNKSWDLKRDKNFRLTKSNIAAIQALSSSTVGIMLTTGESFTTDYSILEKIKQNFGYENGYRISNWKAYLEKWDKLQNNWNISRNRQAIAFDTGGYTGSWDSSGRLAMLHQKEIVLNAQDTENFLSAINIVRDIASMIDLRAAAQQSALSQMTAASVAPTAQTLQQEVTIHAEFPNATQRTEIEAAFDTLLNRASQFANRKN